MNIHSLQPWRMENVRVEFTTEKDSKSIEYFITLREFDRICKWTRNEYAFRNRLHDERETRGNKFENT